MAARYVRPQTHVNVRALRVRCGGALEHGNDLPPRPIATCPSAVTSTTPRLGWKDEAHVEPDTKSGDWQRHGPVGSWVHHQRLTPGIRPRSNVCPRRFK